MWLYHYIHFWGVIVLMFLEVAVFPCTLPEKDLVFELRCGHPSAAKGHRNSYSLAHNCAYQW